MNPKGLIVKFIIANCDTGGRYDVSDMADSKFLKGAIVPHGIKKNKKIKHKKLLKYLVFDIENDKVVKRLVLPPIKITEPSSYVISYDGYRPEIIEDPDLQYSFLDTKIYQEYKKI